ncbi:hypothetical protein SLA2020_199020 [Shorea laevis]
MNMKQTQIELLEHMVMSLEYAFQGLVSIKIDVFNFEVLLLELLCGRKNTGRYYPEHPQPFRICMAVLE